MKRPMTRLLCGSVLVGAMLASATTLIAMDVSALTRAADVVVRGTVVRVESRWTLDHRRIMTDSEILVSETLKGDGVGKTVVVMQPGGVVGEVGQQVHGVATFSLNDEVLVFLERRGDRYFVTGLSQGRFVIDRAAPGEATARNGEADLYLVDEKTHQPVELPVKPLPLSQLSALIRATIAGPQAVPAPTRPAVTAPKATTP
jgi:hypothetical protein